MKKQSQILETFEDLREEQKTYVEYEKDLPAEFNDFVARIPSLEEFLQRGYEILAKTRDYPAEDVRKILRFVAVGKLKFHPGTFTNCLPDALKNKILQEHGRKGKWLSDQAKKNRKAFEKQSSRGGKGGKPEDKIRANAVSYETRFVNKASELWNDRPTVGNAPFDEDVAKAFGQTVTLRMEITRQNRTRLNAAMDEAQRRARKEKNTAFVRFEGPAGGVLTEIVPEARVIA